LLFRKVLDQGPLVRFDAAMLPVHLMQARAKIVAFGFAFLFGVGAGVSVCRFQVLDREMADAKTCWLVCGAHQSALQERAEQYRQKCGRSPTNVQELVEARFLPEFSEVHICPSQVSASMRTIYEGSAWVDQNQAGVVAGCAFSPYHFQAVGGKFSVVCGFDKKHTR
jgi:hypothetical protein